MKTLYTLVIMTLISLSCLGQDLDNPEYTGEYFSLEGALELFKKSSTLEEFEQMINREDNNVNNLDLNNDNEVDYVLVNDIQEGDQHVIVLSTYIKENDLQDIATIGIEKTGEEMAILQIEGDTDLYGENAIFEPVESLENNLENKERGGPSINNMLRQDLQVNVWFWPSVRFLYSPGYVVWHSPWKWRLYPNWWRPWKPKPFSVFHKRSAVYRVYHTRAPFRRVVVANRIYTPRRNHSTYIIHKNRHTKIIKAPKKKRVLKRRRIGG